MKAHTYWVEHVERASTTWRPVTRLTPAQLDHVRWALDAMEDYLYEMGDLEPDEQYDEAALPRLDGHNLIAGTGPGVQNMLADLKYRLTEQLADMLYDAAYVNDDMPPQAASSKARSAVLAYMRIEALHTT